MMMMIQATSTGGELDTPVRTCTCYSTVQKHLFPIHTTLLLLVVEFRLLTDRNRSLDKQNTTLSRTQKVFPNPFDFC